MAHRLLRKQDVRKIDLELPIELANGDELCFTVRLTVPRFASFDDIDGEVLECTYRLDGDPTDRSIELGHAYAHLWNSEDFREQGKKRINNLDEFLINRAVEQYLDSPAAYERREYDLEDPKC